MSRDNANPQYFDGTDVQQAIPPKLFKFWNGSGSTIPAGNAVVPDVAVSAPFGLGTAVKIAPATAAEARNIIGAALFDIPTGALGLIQLAGIQDNVSVLTGTAVGAGLIGSVTTAGRLIVPAFAAGERIVAYNLGPVASNLSRVFWCNPLGL